MAIDLSGRVAIVTGAGRGLGRAHALLLAGRGVKVVVNDLGATIDGKGRTFAAAQAVAEEISAMGGDAFADGSSVTDYSAVEAMIERTVVRWGRVDILINNAGILRDRTFAKMHLDDFRSVFDVHLMGAVHCTKAVWDLMCAQGYGRIVMTTSSSGLFGNFGQANYGAAKLALVGLMQTLGLEGSKYGIRVNCLAPTAGTRMTQGILSQPMLDLLDPASVSPAVLALVSEEAPNRAILCAGAGSFEQAHISITRGLFLGRSEDVAEQILARIEEIGDFGTAALRDRGIQQGTMELAKAGISATEVPGF